MTLKRFFVLCRAILTKKCLKVEIIEVKDCLVASQAFIKLAMRRFGKPMGAKDKERMCRNGEALILRIEKIYEKLEA